MKQFLYSTLCAAIIMLPLDFLWLWSMNSFYKSQIGSIMLDQPRIPPAVAFYLIYVAAIAFLAIMPNLSTGTIWSAAGYGAVLGLAAYGTYDGTNHATLRDFSSTIMFVDWTWGTILTAITSALGWKLMTWWQG